MSKASSWVKSQTKAAQILSVLGLPPCPEFLDNLGGCQARVDESGGLWILPVGVVLTLDEAMKFGRWILDTFGEGEV